MIIFATFGHRDLRVGLSRGSAPFVVNTELSIIGQRALPFCST